jgi:hypothetical protein
MYNHPKQDAKPILVIAGNEREYEDYLKEHNKTRGQAVCISTAKQLDPALYPLDCPIALAGSYWVNTAYDSNFHRMRKQHLQEYVAKETPSNAMHFGGPPKKPELEIYKAALERIVEEKDMSADTLRFVASEALALRYE